MRVEQMTSCGVLKPKKPNVYLLSRVAWKNEQGQSGEKKKKKKRANGD